jgi:ABC-type transporter Mla subunit MlaD
MSRLSNFKVGVIVIVVIALGSWFAFTQANPFANPYELKAFFHDANSLKTRSPVRIAGVEVGKVTKVEAVEAGSDAAQVTMEIEDKGLPIHRDAQLKIRPRIFLASTCSRGRRPSRSSTRTARCPPRRPPHRSRSARC